MTAVEHEGAIGYATEVTRMLWPDPWQPPRLVRGDVPEAPVGADLYVFPTAHRPRLLVPAGVVAAASMLKRLGKDRSPLSRAGRAVLVRLVASSAFPLLRWPRLVITAPNGAQPDSIDQHLGTVLGREVRVGVVLGTPRANRKPVLQIFASDGQLLGYAKVGHNPLTAELVARETRTLTRLQEHRTSSFRTPRVLHSGRWQGLTVLVMSALTGSPGFRAPAAARLAAMRELASLTGTGSGPLGRSAYWSRIDGEVAQVGDSTLARRLRTSVAAIARQWDETDLVFGAWHGDWGHWNTALAGDTLQVWDWERYDAHVPLGFDAVHFAAQGVRPDSRAFPQQQARFLIEAREELLELGVRPEVTGLTFVLYLLEISTRYALSLDFATTPALRRRAAWAMSLLEEQLTLELAVDTEDAGGPA